MTTRIFPVSEAVRRAPYNFPDAPPKEDVNDYLFLSVPGYPPALIRHLGRPDTTAVMAGIYISQELPATQRGLFYPDLVIAFDIDMEAIIARKGFVINEQGKPPDFVLEVGSETTGRRDVSAKSKGMDTRPWASPNTGASIHPGVSITGARHCRGRPWPATGW